MQTTPTSAPTKPVQIEILDDHPRPPIACELTTKQIALKVIRTSTTRQPRNYGPMDVDDLVPSMREHGLIHPIWVRTRTFDMPDPELGNVFYELIVGERRTYAAGQLGWTHISAIVRDDLSDLDIFLIQLEENVRRKPLTILEEADAAARLAAPKSKGGFGIDDTAEIATRLGISVPTVYRRLSLSNASPAVREALVGKRIYEGAAIALSSIRGHDAQNEALAACPPTDDGEPMHVRRVWRIVQDRYHLRLVDAPFDVNAEGLVDGVPICAKCPKRSGATPQLCLLPSTIDPDPEDRCTDRACFAEKRQAWREREVARAREQGLRVIDGKEGRDLYAAGWLVESKAAGLVDFDGKIPGGDGKTFREVIGDGVPHVAIVVDGDERVHYLVDKSKTTEALSAHGITPSASAALGPGKAAGAKGGKAAPTERSDDSFAIERKAQEAAGFEALAEIAAAASRRAAGTRYFRFVIGRVVGLMENRLEHIVERRKLRDHETQKGVKDRDLVMEYVEQLDENELHGMLAELVASADGLHPGDDENHALAVATRFYNVDLAEAVKAHTRKIRGASKRKAEPEAPKPAVPATAAARALKPGTCSACGCDNENPCSADKSGTACVWADAEETLCSVCAHVQTVAISIVDKAEKSPSPDELATLIGEELDGYVVPIGATRITGCIEDATARQKLILYHGRFKRIGPRVVEKDDTAGATPDTAPPPIRTRLVTFLRAEPNMTATRRRMFDGTKLMKPPIAPSDVLREISFMMHDGLCKGAEGAGQITLVAPTFAEALEQIEGLTSTEVKARWTDVMRTAPPSMSMPELRARLATRLSGELPPSKVSPPPNKGRA